MKKIIFLTFLIMLFNSFLFSQSNKNDIPVDKLPEDVKKVLDEYVKILSENKNIDDCAIKFFKIAGGNLLNSDGSDLYMDLKAYSLKKDHDNIKYYQIPVKITRVNKATDDYHGFEKTLIEGNTYKIWIDKKKGVNGLPAPISIIKPKKGSPKVVVIGSL